MKRLRAAIFDVDGVLLDSLPSHLQICQDKSDEFHLSLKIPDAGQLKALARRGVAISPMECFFAAVGFPEKDAVRATADYHRDFMRKYAPAPFAEVHAVLAALHREGIRLGIVTSNYRVNIEAALGQSMPLFEPRLILTHDDMDGETKAHALIRLFTRLGCQPAECLYIGDQLTDWHAARDAGAQFLGVTYGWSISESDDEFPLCSSLRCVRDFVSAAFRGEPLL